MFINLYDLFDISDGEGGINRQLFLRENNKVKQRN